MGSTLPSFLENKRKRREEILSVLQESVNVTLQSRKSLDTWLNFWSELLCRANMPSTVSSCCIKFSEKQNKLLVHVDTKICG